jgi:hypothetical protein
MLLPDTITACPSAAGRGLRGAARSAAWALWLGILVAATVAGFRTVDAFARPEFARQRAKWASPIAPIGRFTAPVPLADGVVVTQAFDADRDGLSGIRVQAVTWGTTPDPHECTWTLEEIPSDDASPQIIARGTVDPTRLTDWAFIDVPFEQVADSGGRRYAITFVSGPGRPAKLLGLPLFETTAGTPHPMVRAASETEPRPMLKSTMHVKLVYTDAGG